MGLFGKPEPKRIVVKEYGRDSFLDLGVRLDARGVSLARRSGTYQSSSGAVRRLDSDGAVDRREEESATRERAAVPPEET
jgi:hypothetical protein